MPTDDDAVEATATSSYEPSVVPLPAPLTRAQVLTDARMLAAAISGVSAAVEMHAERARPAFVDAWRRWAGAWIGYHMYIERMPVNIEQVQAEVRRYGAALNAWRAGLRAEIGASAPAVGGVAPRPADPVPAVAATGFKSLVGDYPWWAIVGGAVGITFGGYHAIKWAMRQWVGSPRAEED